MSDEAMIKVYGYNDDNDEWLPVQVDENGVIQVVQE